LEELGKDEKIVLECSGNREKNCGLNSSGSGYGPVAFSCENGNELWVP